MKVRFIVVIPVGFGVNSLLPQGEHTRAQLFLTTISSAIDSIVLADTDTDIAFTNAPLPPLSLKSYLVLLKR